MHDDLKTGGQTPRTDFMVLRGIGEIGMMQHVRDMERGLNSIASMMGIKDEFIDDPNVYLSTLIELMQQWTAIAQADLAAHAEDRAMLETLRVFILQMAGASNSQVSAFVRAACAAVLSNQPEPKLPPGDPLKTIATLTAQLGAARRERDAIEKELNQEMNDANKRMICALALQEKAKSERDALRAEIEQLKKKRSLDNIFRYGILYL